MEKSILHIQKIAINEPRKISSEESEFEKIDDEITESETEISVFSETKTLDESAAFGNKIIDLLKTQNKKKSLKSDCDDIYENYKEYGTQ